MLFSVLEVFRVELHFNPFTADFQLHLFPIHLYAIVLLNMLKMHGSKQPVLCLSREIKVTISNSALII